MLRFIGVEQHIAHFSLPVACISIVFALYMYLFAFFVLVANICLWKPAPFNPKTYGDGPLVFSSIKC